jgi:spore coat polysaccharide biosynthesis predicted glycosyltransferase SpsG
MGLPSVLVSIAENQRQVCEDLAQEGYIAYLGASHMLTDGKIEAALRKYLCQPLRENWSEKCFSLCDGDGVARILNALGY